MPKKPSIFADVNTLVCKQGERTFPFMRWKTPPKDWDMIYWHWRRYIRWMKKEGIMNEKNE